MAIVAERLVAEVTADTSKAEKGLDNFSSKAEKSSGGMSALKATVVGFAGAAVGGIAGKAVMAASDLNEVVSKTGVVFGKQTDDVTGYAQQMADKFGLPKTAVLDAASSFGLLGKAAGLSGTDVSKMSTNLAGLAADAMSFYNVPLDQALGDFTSALSGESEPVKKYGILMNDAAVQAEALALGLVKPVKNMAAIKSAQVNATLAQNAYNEAVKKHGKNSVEAQKAGLGLEAAQKKVADAMKGSVPALTEGQKVQARTSLITKGLKDANGDLARTQSSVSNRIREAQGRIQNYAADIGTKALPAVAGLLGGAVGLMKGLGNLGQVFQEHRTMILSVAGVITAIILPALVAWGVTSTINGAKAVLAWVQTQAAAIASGWAHVRSGARIIASWVAQAAAAVASGAETVAVWALYKAEAIKAAGVQAAQSARIAASWVAMQVQAMAQAGRMALAWTIGVIRQAAVAAAAMAVNVARIVGGWVLMGIQSMIQAARMAAAWFIALGPVGWVIAAVIGLVALIIANWDTVVKWTKKAWSAVSAALVAAWEWIKGAATAYFNAYRAVVTAVWNGIKTATSAAWNYIKNLLVTAWAGIRNIVTSYVNGVRYIITTAWNTVRSITSSAWNGIKSAISGAVNGVLGVVRGIPGRIRSALGNLGALLRDSGARIMQGLADGIWNGLGRVTDAVRGVLQRARNLLPFSPAKEGPFSGKGWTLHSGRSISAALAQGIKDNAGQVRQAALGMARAAVPSIGGVTVPSWAAGAVSGPRRAATEAGAVTPSSARGGAGGPGGSQTVVFNTYYPLPERQSQTVNRSLQKVAALQTA